MKKNPLIAIVVVVIVIFGGLAAYFMLQPAPPAPAAVQVQAPPPPPPPPPAPVVRQEIVPPPAPAPEPLPTLNDSDRLMLDALAGLLGNKSLMKLLHTERIIRHVVATIDNLPRRRAPMKVMPFERASGQFITSGSEENPTISLRNAARYRPYVKIAQVIDAKKVVELYVRLYPLFQEAYEELGYPGKYFNDRLVVAIDNLLAAPDIKEPVKLVRPNVFYLFADPDLEGRSIGQRILMRVGSNNEAIVKAKLREIKRELALHTHEKKVAAPR